MGMLGWGNISTILVLLRMEGTDWDTAALMSGYIKLNPFGAGFKLLLGGCALSKFSWNLECYVQS